MDYCHNKKGAINLTASIIIVVVMLVVLIFAFALPGAALGLIREPETVPGTSILDGAINCARWENDIHNYQEIITSAANEFKVQPALVGAIFLSEQAGDWSRRQPWKTSPSDAKGPFQFKDPTWGQYGMGGDMQDFNDAARGAAKYLNDILTRYVKTDSLSVDETSIKLAAASYNGGPTCIDSYRHYLQTGETEVCSVTKDSAPSNETKGYIVKAWEYFSKLNVDCVSHNLSADGCLTGGGKKKVVVIDPGHGSPGNQSSWEDANVLEVGKLIKSELEAAGVTVYMTREKVFGLVDAVNQLQSPFNKAPNETQQYTDNYKRAVYANNLNASLALHIHSDSKYDEGFFFLYSDARGKDKMGNPSQQTDEAIADQTKFVKIASDILKKTFPAHSKQGAYTTTNSFYSGYQNLSYDAASKVPSVTIEMYGHENTKLHNAFKSDGEWQYSTGMVKKIKTTMAKELAKGITEYLKTLPDSGSCTVADTAIAIALDAYNKDGGIAGIYSKDMSSKNSYYANYLKKGVPKKRSFNVNVGGPAPWYADCGSFASFVISHFDFDPDFPTSGSGKIAEYVNKNPNKYKTFSIDEHGQNLQPGDILFWSETGGGHVEIFIGENKMYPGKTVITAGLGTNHGPIFTTLATRASTRGTTRKARTYAARFIGN